MAWDDYVLRGERWELSYGIEDIYGTDPGTANLTNFFGVFEKATLGDPELEFMPFWGITDTAGRTYSIAYKGKWAFTSSIGDVLLINACPLHLPIGLYGDTGSSPTFTHTATSANELPSLTMHSTFWDSNGTIKLMRRNIGGKVSKASYTAEEGGQLKMSIDELVFKNISHDQSGYAKYAAGVARPTITLPTTEPYYFSMGTVTLVGASSLEIARIKSFKLDVNNNCEPKYYVSDNADAGRIPYEIREGRREIDFSATVDVSDAALFNEILQEGTYSDVYKGLQVTIVFERDTNDTITFTLPPDTPAAGTHAQGCLLKKGKIDIVTDPVVPQELEFMVRDVKIVAVDSVASWN